MSSIAPDPAALLAIGREIAQQARRDEAVEVCVGHSVRTEVRVHDGSVESLTVAESHGIGVRVVVDGREGLAGAGTFAPELIGDLVAEARDNALFAEPDERVGLAEPDGVEPVALDPWDDEVATTPIDAKIDLALQAEQLTRAADQAVRGLRAAMYGDTRSASAIVSTTGIEDAGRSATCGLSVVALIDDIDGGTRTGSASNASRRPSELDPAEVASLAVARGLALRGARPPSTGRIPVVLEPRFAATVLGLVASMLSGELVVKGRTPFADRVGELVAASTLTMFDNPTDPESLSASATDGEGLACRRVPLITDGRLDGFLHDSHSARGLGVASTGSAVRGVRSAPQPGLRSLAVAPGAGDLESTISSLDYGLVVQGLQGLHSGVNAVSGDLSVGVEGIMIRDGERAEPVREGTLAGAIPRLLLDIAKVGSDLERQPGGALVPSLQIDGLTLGGTSD